MTFEIKAGDVVVVSRECGEEFFARVQRVTKTQIITQGYTESISRYSLQSGRDLSAHYSRWARRNCIVRLADSEQAQQYITQVEAERERIAKQREIAQLFAGLPVDGPWLSEAGWRVVLKFEGLTEERVRQLAETMKPLRAVGVEVDDEA